MPIKLRLRYYAHKIKEEICLECHVLYFLVREKLDKE